MTQLVIRFYIAYFLVVKLKKIKSYKIFFSLIRKKLLKNKRYWFSLIQFHIAFEQSNKITY